MPKSVRLFARSPPVFSEQPQLALLYSVLDAAPCVFIVKNVSCNYYYFLKHRLVKSRIILTPVADLH